MSRKKNKIQKTYYSKAEGENRTINLQFCVTAEELKKIERGICITDALLAKFVFRRLWSRGMTRLCLLWGKKNIEKIKIELNNSRNLAIIFMKC